MTERTHPNVVVTLKDGSSITKVFSSAKMFNAAQDVLYRNLGGVVILALNETDRFLVNLDNVAALEMKKTPN